MASSYSDTQVQQALAALECNAGNVKRTALQLGIPRTTLLSWRDGVSRVPDTEKPSVSHDFAAMWGEVQELATKRMRELIPGETDLRAVATAAGIAADKHLDYTLGRKGGSTVNVDNSTKTVTITYEDRRNNDA